MNNTFDTDALLTLLLSFLPYSQDLLVFLLTHWGRGKMAVTLADDTFKCKFVNENILISITVSLKCVPTDPINNMNMPALV